MSVQVEVVTETDRLLVRQWRQSDAERVLDIQSRWEVVRWLDDDARVLIDLGQAVERIRSWQAVTATDGADCGHWAVEVKDTGVVAGAVMLLPLPTLNRPAGSASARSAGTCTPTHTAAGTRVRQRPLHSRTGSATGCGRSTR